MHFYQINADLDTFVKNIYLFLNGNTLHIFFLHKYQSIDRKWFNIIKM